MAITIPPGNSIPKDPRKPQNHRIIGVRKRTKCWYRSDRLCPTPKDCEIAGYCCTCWNPAEVAAMRSSPLWVWAEPW